MTTLSLSTSGVRLGLPVTVSLGIVDGIFAPGVLSAAFWSPLVRSVLSYGFGRIWVLGPIPHVELTASLVTSGCIDH